jgi:hypothetical protein
MHCRIWRENNVQFAYSALLHLTLFYSGVCGVAADASNAAPARSPNLSRCQLCGTPPQNWPEASNTVHELAEVPAERGTPLLRLAEGRTNGAAKSADNVLNALFDALMCIEKCEETFYRTSCSQGSPFDRLGEREKLSIFAVWITVRKKTEPSAP